MTVIRRFDASARCNFVSSACVFNLSHVLSAFPLGDDDMIRNEEHGQEIATQQLLLRH